MADTTRYDSLGILSLQLNEQSKQALKDLYRPKYPDVYCDHVTLVYGIPKDAATYCAGKSATVSVYAYASNERVEAVRVATHGLPDTYGTPHITLSSEKGIDPFESVAMLKSRHDEQSLASEVSLQGTVKFIPFTEAERAEFMQGTQKDRLFYFTTSSQDA